MITKDGEYLNQKLNQLKQSVLSRNNHLLNSEKKSGVYQKKTYFQNNPKNILKNENFPNYIDKKNVLLAKNISPNPFKYKLEKEPFKISTNKIMSLRNIHVSDKTNRIKSSKIIPKVDFPYNYQEVKLSENYEIPQENRKSINLRSSKSVDPYKIIGKTNFSNNPYGNNILDSILKTSHFSKHKNNLQIDLTEKLNDNIEKNAILENELNLFSGKLEEEKKKLENLDDICGEELKSNKITEGEKINDFEKLNMEHQELSEKLNFEEDRKIELANDIEKIEYDNKMLKNELKRISELTAEKLLDLENNINSIGRMRDFEKENYDMEKEKVVNSSEFVVEQMKAHFEERSNQINLKKKNAEIEKNKILNDLKIISNELRNFNSNADNKIRNIMNTIINEEEIIQNKEIKEIEDKITIQESNLNNHQLENRNLIENIQNIERDFKGRIMNKKNINLRLREELAHLENNYNKIYITLNSENKQNSQKETRLTRLEDELKEIKEKTRNLEVNYKKELENVALENEEMVEELNNDFNGMLQNEKNLIDEISIKKEELLNLQQKHQKIIENIQKNLNNTLQVK